MMLHEWIALGGLTCLVIGWGVVEYANWKMDRELPDPIADDYQNQWEHGYELLTGRKR